MAAIISSKPPSGSTVCSLTNCEAIRAFLAQALDIKNCRNSLNQICWTLRDLPVVAIPQSRPLANLVASKSMLDSHNCATNSHPQRISAAPLVASSIMASSSLVLSARMLISHLTIFSVWLSVRCGFRMWKSQIIQERGFRSQNFQAFNLTIDPILVNRNLEEGVGLGSS
ncbi:hypothetical protein SISNIDRAFT_470384 [Sistotremastrum niveocremeum HHB9708]|uniref:Uncharacterized protein n=1 Tax=Sistotremastrum niveocremeum HHB9708 TaxID=1314777 RepID=A0A164P0D0_9AGAM|nr:hypothetical protein SISNIDRAFT_470384 [Sistotremastrum niveocremeum HHB9708]